MNAVDGQGGTTAWELADEVKDAGKKAAVLEVLSEYSLHAAAKAGKAERVRALIAAGQEVNAQGGQYFDGMTAAQLAVLGGHDETLKVLLAAGVDVNAKNGVSPSVHRSLSLSLPSSLPLRHYIYYLCVRSSHVYIHTHTCMHARAHTRACACVCTRIW